MNSWIKLAALALTAWASTAWAIAPFVKADSVAAGDVASSMAQVEKKLQAAGFSVIGSYAPKGIADSGVVVATDKGILDAIGQAGGDVIVGAAIRIGVKKDGSVSYMNPEYWYRAYFRKRYQAAEGAVTSLQAKLKQTLGARGEFGGDIERSDLAHYHYMFGMEYFEDDRDLAKHSSFEQAVGAIRANLAKGVGKTSKVYEVVIPDKEIAVFGVAMDDPQQGEGAWVNKISGAEHVAALPYEIFVVGNKTEALYGRYRIALSWPALTMGSFTKIIGTPGDIQSTLKAVAQ